MLEKYLEDYVNRLYEKQNNGVSLEQQGLYTKKDYFELLKPVIELVSDYKDYSIDDLRNKLYNDSQIEEKLNDFIYKKEMVPGMVLAMELKTIKKLL